MPNNRKAKASHLCEEGGQRRHNFINHVNQFAEFYDWNDYETCHQARAHLRDTFSQLYIVSKDHLLPRETGTNFADVVSWISDFNQEISP